MKNMHTTVHLKAACLGEIPLRGNYREFTRQASCCWLMKALKA